MVLLEETENPLASVMTLKQKKLSKLKVLLSLYLQQV